MDENIQYWASMSEHWYKSIWALMYDTHMLRNLRHT